MSVVALGGVVEFSFVSLTVGEMLGDKLMGTRVASGWAEVAGDREVPGFWSPFREGKKPSAGRSRLARCGSSSESGRGWMRPALSICGWRPASWAAFKNVYGCAETVEDLAA